MKILLTGASGFIGSHLLKGLQQYGYDVIAPSHHQLDLMQMNSSDDYLPHLQGIDVVINSVGIIAENREQSFDVLHYQAPARLFRACKLAGVKRVIQISALGADDSAIVPYHKTKKAADDVLRSLDLAWFVLRPSLVYGEKGKSFSLFQRLSNLPVIPLFGDGQQMIQPVHISDVVATVLRCLEDGVPAKQTIDVVGKQALTYQNWLKNLRTRKSPPVFVKMPMPLMMKLAHLGKFINLPLFNPDSLRMLQQNNVADSTGLSRFIGREPL